MTENFEVKLRAASWSNVLQLCSLMQQEARAEVAAQGYTDMNQFCTLGEEEVKDLVKAIDKIIPVSRHQGSLFYKP